MHLGKKEFDYARLHVFGCNAYMLDYEHTSFKFNLRSQKLKFVGYAPGSYKLLDVEN
jgi:hypothetical protein